MRWCTHEALPPCMSDYPAQLAIYADTLYYSAKKSKLFDILSTSELRDYSASRSVSRAIVVEDVDDTARSSTYHVEIFAAKGLLTLGDIGQPTVLLAALGFFVICALHYRNITGSIIIGILLVTILSILLGLNQAQGIVSAPPSIAPTFFAIFSMVSTSM